MIAFSLSRIAFVGFAVALMIGLGASFLTGWLAALSQQPVADMRAMAASKLVADKATDPAEPIPTAQHSAIKPVEERGTVAATAPGAPSTTPAPGAPVAAPASPPAPPETAMAAAFSQPALRFGMPPATTVAPLVPPPADSLAAGDAQRSLPQEMNAEFGRLGDPLRPVYTVEAGLFSAEHAAEALYLRLDAERYDVYRVDGGSSYGIAVRVGAFNDRRLAEQAAVELRAREGVDARVLRVAPAMMAEVAKAKRETH